MPIKATDRIVTLNEGNTPLVRADRLATPSVRGSSVLKCEAQNPTGSFRTAA